MWYETVLNYDKNLTNLSKGETYGFVKESGKEAKKLG